MMLLNLINGGARAIPEMARTSVKMVAPIRLVKQATILTEVGISGLLFFGSFAFGELAEIAHS
jgi:hypothetical protein